MIPKVLLVVRSAVRVVSCTGERRIGAAAALWLSLYFTARLLLELEFSPWVRVAIALTPLPAFGWFLREFIRGVGDMDELERRVQLEALAVAFPLTLLLLMILGLLQIAIELPMEDWSYRHIWPLIYVFYLVGIVRARRRYQ